jgi:phosphopantothenoylcysteine decarboxylase/phosphopantothenate--cysteine ligase
MLVAPATNNIIAKVASGLCDDLVSLLICAAACPVVFVPAMNSRMWENRVFQRNLSTLRELGYEFIGPEEGWLACRHVGKGRMSDAQKIVGHIEEILSRR